MFLNDDDMVECPYNSSHRMLRKRFQSHIIKCRLQYPNVELRKCPFNITHLIPEPEFSHHARNCPDRNLITQYKYDAPEPKEEDAPKHAPIECDDNWDDTDVKDYNPRLHLEKANVLLRPDGANPSERKLFIKKQRTRLGDDSDDSGDGAKTEASCSKSKRRKYESYRDDVEIHAENDGRGQSPKYSRSVSPYSGQYIYSPAGWRRTREYSPPGTYTRSYNSASHSNAATQNQYRRQGGSPTNDSYNSGREYSYSSYGDYQAHYGSTFARNSYMPEAPPPPIISQPTPKTHSSKYPNPPN